jgi:hypothetical protein
MQSMLSDFALVSQLYAFMEVIPALRSWDALRNSYVSGETYTEQRGPESNFLQLEFQILEEGSKDGGQYLHVSVSVTDPLRANGQRGSSTTPMCTSFLFFKSGEVDMPLAREIYERPF